MFITMGYLLSLIGFTAAEASADQDRLTISNAPEHIAQYIFVGPDREMPISTQFNLSIEPTTREDDIWIPETLSEAFTEMENALPHWYQVALITSGGDFECSVSVNNVDLNLITMNWLWINWRLAEPESELRKTLENMGAENRDQVLFGLHDGFCYYLKYGEEKAMELLTSPDSEEWQEREYPPLGSSKNDNP